ncbi:hypothetical protein C8R43DRAFT_1237899 [Mycena crocata]|nr:hypothetical protein C8R43DRAFT_1237899 [Mycena crocata]
MATPIQISFAGLGREFTALPWNLPKHHEPFEALLTDAIVLPKSLLINGMGPRVPHEVTFEEAGNWGLEWGLEEGDSSLVYGQAQSLDGSTKFCLRFIMNAVETTRDKKSLTFRTYLRLLKDARFHSKYLDAAEGLLVPMHYGMWLMDTGDWAGKVLCSITQWCGQPWSALSRTKLNTRANKILIGRTLEFLHDYGVVHGGFSSTDDFRHLIFDVDAPGLSSADLLNGKAPCYIVDFAEARPNHTCARKLPVLPLDALVLEEVGCDEMAYVTYALGFTKASSLKFSPGCETYKAIQWHAEYSKLNPGWKNSEVLIAQRAKLFIDFPPLYRGLQVWFEGDEQYSTAFLERDSPSDEETELAEGDMDASREDSASPTDPTEALGEKFQLQKLDDSDVTIKLGQ